MPGEPRDPSAGLPPGRARTGGATARVAASSVAPDAVAASGVAVKRPSPLVPILAAAVVAAAVVAAVVLLVTRDGGAPDPTSVVRDYYAAVGAGDCATMVDLIDTDGQPGEPDRTAMVESCRHVYAEEGATLDAVDLEAARLVTHEGDRAVVRAEMAGAASGEPGATEEIRLVRIDGEWKIDLARGGDGADRGADPRRG